MQTKPQPCHDCPAYTYGLGFVPPWNPTRPPRFAFIGQGPGEHEAEFAQPFYPQAPSGRTLRGWLHDAGIDDRDCAFGNVVCCWLPKTLLHGGFGKESREPTRAEAAFCYHAHVEPWLRALPKNCHLFTVGAAATRFVLQLEGAVDHLNGITHFVELPTAGS